MAIARSVRSAAELTKVDENEIKLCCENRQNLTEQYYFRYNTEPTIAGDDALGNLTLTSTTNSVIINNEKHPAKV